MNKDYRVRIQAILFDHIFLRGVEENITSFEGYTLETTLEKDSITEYTISFTDCHKAWNFLAAVKLSEYIRIMYIGIRKC